LLRKRIERAGRFSVVKTLSISLTF